MNLLNLFESNDSGFQALDAWKQQVLQAHPDHAGKIKFLGRDNQVSAEVPGQDRSFGVFDLDTEQGQVLDEAYNKYHANRTGFAKPQRDLSGEGEPEGMFAVVIDGRTWKEFTSNKAFTVAKTIATKYPNKTVQVKWPNGQLNTVKEDVTEAVEDRTSYQVAKVLSDRGIKYDSTREGDLIKAIGVILVKELNMSPAQARSVINDPDFIGDTFGELQHMRDHRLDEKWSQKYKSSINCSHPKGFSQRAHCAGKKKHNESVDQEMVCEDCGMCQTHGSLNEIKKGQKDSNGYTRCWPGKHAEGTKKGKNGGQVRNCVPNESQGVAEGSSSIEQKIIKLYKQGLSDDEIASRLKIDSDDVKSVLDDYEWVADTTGEGEGVAEGSTNDYFKRRKDEEDRIAGKKAPAKRTPRQTDYEKKRKEQGVAEGDPSGIMHAAKNYNRSFLITAELAEGGKKTFRVRAQSERVAREKFDQHYNQATIVSVKEEGITEASEELPQWKKDWYAKQKPNSWPKHPQPYHDPDWIAKLPPEELKKLTGKKGMSEGDNPWGNQGNFVGDSPQPNIGGVTVNKLQVGDTVTYLGQRARIDAMSKTGNTSRITIANNMGGVTKDVLTSDLKRTGIKEEGPSPETGFGAEGSKKLGTVNTELISRAWRENRPNVVLTFGKSGEYRLDRGMIRYLLGYYKALPDDNSKWYFIYETMSRLEKLVALLEKANLPNLGIPTPGQQELDLTEKKRPNDDLSSAGARDADVQRALQRARAATPTASSDIGALVKQDLRTQEKTQQKLADIEADNQRQMDMLKKNDGVNVDQQRAIRNLERQVSKVPGMPAIAKSEPTPAPKKSAVAPVATAVEPARIPPMARPRPTIGNKVPASVKIPSLKTPRNKPINLPDPAVAVQTPAMAVQEPTRLQIPAPQGQQTVLPALTPQAMPQYNTTDAVDVDFRHLGAAPNLDNFDEPEEPQKKTGTYGEGIQETANDTVKFSIDGERAYDAVMDRFGHVIDWNDDSMTAPRNIWPRIEEIAHDFGGEASEEGSEFAISDPAGNN